MSKNVKTCNINGLLDLSLIHILMEKLLNDELKEKEEIEFYEPDLEFTLYPKINLWNTGKYTDHFVQLVLFLFSHDRKGNVIRKVPFLRQLFKPLRL